MKKIVLPVAAGQFLLAAVLGYMCVQFKMTTADSELVEQQLAENCSALKSALVNADESYSSSGVIVGNLSGQLRKLAKTMIKQSDVIRVLLSKKREKQLAEIGFMCRDTADALDKYREKTAPEVANALQKTAETLQKTSELIRERHPFTRTAQYVLLLGICFVVICVVNGSLLVAFVLMKTENDQKKEV